MKDKTNQLIQVYDNEGDQLAIFKFTGNNCPEDHLEKVFEEYFEYEDDESANLHLFRWGLERVYIEHVVYLN